MFTENTGGVPNIITSGGEHGFGGAGGSWIFALVIIFFALVFLGGGTGFGGNRSDGVTPATGAAFTELNGRLNSLEGQISHNNDLAELRALYTQACATDMNVTQQAFSLSRQLDQNNLGNYNCSCCKLESISITVAGGVMTITIIPSQAFFDYRFYQLNLCQALPAHIGTEPVSISDGTNSYPVIDTNGQPVVSGKLRCHRRYRIRYGAGGALSSGTIPAHFTVYDGLCCMEYSSNAALQAPAAG